MCNVLTLQDLMSNRTARGALGSTSVQSATQGRYLWAWIFQNTIQNRCTQKWTYCFMISFCVLCRWQSASSNANRSQRFLIPDIDQSVEILIFWGHCNASRCQECGQDIFPHWQRPLDDWEVVLQQDIDTKICPGEIHPTTKDLSIVRPGKGCVTGVPLWTWHVLCRP